MKIFYSMLFLLFGCFLGGCGNGGGTSNSSVANQSTTGGSSIPPTSESILVIGSCWIKTTVADLSEDMYPTATTTYGVNGANASCTFGTEGDIAYLQTVFVGEYQYIVFDTLTDIDLTHPNMMTTPTQYQQNLGSIITMIRALGAKPIFVNMPPMKNDPSHPIISIQQYNSLSLSVMQQQNVAEDNVYDILLPYGLSVWYDTSDYYLLNTLGNQVVADSVRDTIQSTSY